MVTTQREIADRLGLPVHPPKVETFDFGPRTNTDSKQLVRDVDEYRVEPFGLYMARPMIDHPKLTYMESWLLPELGIRVTDFHRRPGHRRPQDFYVDIVSIEPGPDRWRSVDLYLDIVVETGRHAEVLDVDEFLLALRSGLLDDTTAQHAMATTHTTLDGLARHHYDLPCWLRESGVELSWHGRPDRISSHSV